MGGSNGCCVAFRVAFWGVNPGTDYFGFGGHSILRASATRSSRKGGRRGRWRTLRWVKIEPGSTPKMVVDGTRESEHLGEEVGFVVIRIAQISDKLRIAAGCWGYILDDRGREAALHSYVGVTALPELQMVVIGGGAPGWVP